MERIGEVVKILENGRAVVRFERTKACKNCKMCANAGENHALTEVENTLRTKVGDAVEISLHSKSLLQATLIAYGIPLLMLLIGVVVGSMWSDAVGAIAGIVLALAAFAILRLLEPRFSRMTTFKPRMIDIIETADKESEL